MDYQFNVPLNSSEKPSKLLALLALVFAFTLPFIMVKIFPHKHKTKLSPPPSWVPEINKSDPLHLVRTEKPIHNVSTKQTLPISTKTTPIPRQSIIHKTSVWRVIKIRSGDSLGLIFKRIGLSAGTLQDIIDHSQQSRILTKLKPEQNLRFLIKNKKLEKMIFPVSTTQYLVVYRDGRQYHSQMRSRKMVSQNKIITATVKNSLYNTAKNNSIPMKLIKQMTSILAWGVNFSKDVHAGDRFTIIYKSFSIKNKTVAIGNIVAVSYLNRKHLVQAVQYTNRYGVTDYYTPQGTTFKKAFNRYPINFSHISSTFSLSRYHPILHYNRAHKGIDLAAPIGTPIRATSDGRIDTIGRQGGYGNMIKIRHSGAYSTLYGHMLKFQKGLYRGSFVRKGQVIGYVGQSGLASGPHCHYEFHVNNQPRNPATIKLPNNAPLNSRELANFKANANRWLAQIKVSEKHAILVAQRSASSIY